VANCQSGAAICYNVRRWLTAHEAAFLIEDEPRRFSRVDHGAELLATAIRALCAKELLRCDRGRRYRRREVVGVRAPCGLGQQEAWDVVVQLLLVKTRRGYAGQGIGEVVVRSLLVVHLEVELR